MKIVTATLILDPAILYFEVTIYLTLETGP